MVLDSPVCFKGGRLKTEYNQTIIQLMMPPADMPAELLGSVISVRGVVGHGSNAQRHYTDIIMQPVEI